MGIILIAGAALAVPVPVLAISAGGIKSTIASIIISLLVSTGYAPTNTQWLNSLNSAYGVSSTIGTIEDCITNGLLTETANGLVDSGLSNAISSLPEYTSLGLDQMFQTVATDAGVAAASGAANLAGTAINVGTLGTIGAFAGAAAVGVGLGVLINHVRESIVNFVKNGINFDAPETIRDRIGLYTGSVLTMIASDGSGRMVGWNIEVAPYCLKSSPQSTFTCLNYSSQYAYYTLTIFDKDQIIRSETTGMLNPGTTQTLEVWNSTVFRHNYAPVFTNRNEYTNYENGLKNNFSNTFIPNYNNHDFVGPGGNVTYIPDGNGGGTLSGGEDLIIPDGYDMTPIDMTDYQSYIENANQNTDNGLTGEETQGAEFDDFVEPYLVPTENTPDNPDTPIIPDNPIDVPTYPDRPVNPEQPTVPDKPDIPAEDIETNLDLTATPDLRGVFPFCIPWDIYNLVHIFDTGDSRQAPEITFTFPGTDWNINIDLSVFDPVAGILRLLQLILFIVGLMVATRSLIGAGG